MSAGLALAPGGDQFERGARHRSRPCHGLDGEDVGTRRRCIQRQTDALSLSALAR